MKPLVDVLSLGTIPDNVCRVSMDIGGTLAKVIFIVDDDQTPPENVDEKKYIQLWTNSKIYFKHFLTKEIDLLIEFLQQHNLTKPNAYLPITGGGAFKFESLFKEKLGVIVARQDEMDTLMCGIEFIISRDKELYSYTESKRIKEYKPPLKPEECYPFLLVNIGSGVSILHAISPGVHKRVTGTCVGGGTVLALAHLLTGAQSFDEVIELSSKGDTRLDLTVADLCGDAAGSRLLPPDTLASSFGRVNSMLPSELRREDIARSVVNMVAYNLGYVALLVSRLRNLGRVLFSGKFIADHEPTMEAITKGVCFYADHYAALLSQNPSHTNNNNSSSLSSSKVNGHFREEGDGHELDDKQINEFYQRNHSKYNHPKKQVRYHLEDTASAGSPQALKEKRGEFSRENRIQLDLMQQLACVPKYPCQTTANSPVQQPKLHPIEDTAKKSERHSEPVIWSPPTAFYTPMASSSGLYHPTKNGGFFDEVLPPPLMENSASANILTELKQTSLPSYDPRLCQDHNETERKPRSSSPRLYYHHHHNSGKDHQSAAPGSCKNSHHLHYQKKKKGVRPLEVNHEVLIHARLAAALERRGSADEDDDQSTPVSLEETASDLLSKASRTSSSQPFCYNHRKATTDDSPPPGLAPEVLFLTHDGELGAIGAWLLTLRGRVGESSEK